MHERLVWARSIDGAIKDAASGSFRSARGSRARPSC